MNDSIKEKKENISIYYLPATYTTGVLCAFHLILIKTLWSGHTSHIGANRLGEIKYSTQRNTWAAGI